MNLALSKKDQSLLIGLLGLLFLFVSWYFVFNPLQEKTTVLEAENVALKEKADLYQSINARLPQYEEEIETYKSDIVEISNRYPVQISREDEILFLSNMENTYNRDLALENITMSSVEEIFPESAVQQTAQPVAPVEGEAAPDGAVATEPEIVVPEIHLYAQPVNYSFRSTYKGIKDMITYLFAQNDTKAIQGLSLAFDTETGNLMGNLDLNQFYMTGTGREYQPIPVPTVTKGVSDVFHTVNGSAGVDAVLTQE